MNQAKQKIVLAVTLAEHGGVQEFLVRFALYLQSHGHEVTILAGEGEWLFERCREEGICAKKLRYTQRAIQPWQDMLALRELKELLHELKPDAIHLNSTKMGVLGALAARSLDVPKIVYRIGGWVFLEALAPHTKRFYRWIEKVSASWKDVIICVHPNDKALAIKAGIKPRQDIRVIPNGIDIHDFEAHLLSREEARRELGIPDDSFVFGTLANFFPAKNLPEYFKTCANIHTIFPQAQFVVIGDGGQRAQLEKLREQLLLDDVVLLPGRKAQASRFLKAFDTFVLPSSKEGMSWALLEAMAAKLPCVVTEVGANHWLLEGAGWVVPAEDSAKLAAAMTESIQNTDKAKSYAKSAYDRVSKDFPLEKTLQDNEKALID